MNITIISSSIINATSICIICISIIDVGLFNYIYYIYYLPYCIYYGGTIGIIMICNTIIRCNSKYRYKLLIRICITIISIYYVYRYIMVVYSTVSKLYYRVMILYTIMDIYRYLWYNGYKLDIIKYYIINRYYIISISIINAYYKYKSITYVYE